MKMNYPESCLWGVLERLTERDYKELNIEQLELFQQTKTIIEHLALGISMGRLSYLPDASIQFIINKQKELS